MPIRFVDQDDIEELGYAAFLRIHADVVEPGFIGAILQINARGEPVEFTYSRVVTPEPFMWRAGDLERSALKKLSMSLLSACSTAPNILLYRASEIPDELFQDAIQIAVPVARISVDAETENDAEEASVIEWLHSPPQDTSTEARLVHELARRHLLWEPFERARHGLSEVFGERERERDGT